MPATVQPPVMTFGPDEFGQNRLGIPLASRAAAVFRSDSMLALTPSACVLGDPVREHAHHGHGDSGALTEHARELTMTESNRPHGAVRHKRCDPGRLGDERHLP